MKKLTALLLISGLLFSCTKNEQPERQKEKVTTYTIQIIGVDEDGTYSETDPISVRY